DRAGPELRPGGGGRRRHLRAARGPPRPGPGRGGHPAAGPPGGPGGGRGVAGRVVPPGRRVRAAEAGRVGLADRVVPRAEVLAAATALAGEIAANAPTALRPGKRGLGVGGALSRE